MDRRRTAPMLPQWPMRLSLKSAPLPAAVYRDLVSPLFTMGLPIIGFGFLYVFVCSLILIEWPDPVIKGLMLSGVAVTAIRVILLNRFRRAGGASQSVDDLAIWERRYAIMTFVFALLLAGLNIRALAVHEPLMHMGTISLVFVFGAGVVSRISSRPRICVGSLLISVIPTALTMLVHAGSPGEQPLHGAFFILFAFLLLTVLAMSLDSVRFLYSASLEQFMTKHDLNKLARYDALTGLPNRLTLREAFYSGLEQAQNMNTQLAIHYLDLDGFKAINDGYGHPIGDRLLKEVAHRLLATIRSEDIAFRLGGDEFLLIQGGVFHRDEAELIARRIIRQLSDPYVFDGREMRISVSIGIAMTAELGFELDALVACADTALYTAKAQGKRQLHFCDCSDYREPGRSAA